MQVPDMYTAKSCVRYTSEVKLWEHSGNRDGGSRYVHLPGAVSGTHVGLKLWEHSRNRDAGFRYVHLPGDVSGTHVVR
jgi:hypothetical protein